MIYGKIDLRSDTVTIPTEEMRKAMAEAIVGDDVYGDDPTINELESMAAAMFHKEAALFVPSGTMSNQLALFTHVNRGEEVILPDECHVVVHEVGAAAILSGAQLRCIQCDDGEMPLSVVERAIRKNPDEIHQTKTALITYENADSNGQVRSLEYMKRVKALAHKYHIPVHIDGARIFNAATFLRISVEDMSPYFDTISVCLSKGLCAPIGSLLIGSAEFIKKARKKRKTLGGGMRQAGILGAAGIIALKDMTKRLHEDHEHARYFAEQLETVEGIRVYKDRVQINMVFFSLNGYKRSSDELVAHLAEHNILSNGDEDGLLRFVTHNYLSKEEIDQVIAVMKA